MTTAPTFGQIKAQLAAIRKKHPNTRRVAIRSKSKWTGEKKQVDGSETYLIHQCDSPLAMRIALRTANDNATTVLITDLDDLAVGGDVLVRLKPRKLVPLDSWQIVKALFQARSIDPRITKHPWIADTLMELIPTDGFPPVASGFLDAETVWTILLKRVVGLEAENADLLAVLKWSTDGDLVEKFRNASAEFRQAAGDWLVSSAGPTAATVLDCIGKNHRPDALPLGLAAGVVFHPDRKGESESAAVRLEERYLGGKSPGQESMTRWAAAATEVVRLQLSDPRLKQLMLQRSDEILVEIGAKAHAHLSDTSPLGFDRRLDDFGVRLADWLASMAPGNLEALLAARRSILQHDRQSRERRRLERVDMALRLANWLSSRGNEAVHSSLAEAACYHLSEGGFVDWARLTLRSGDPIRELSQAYAKLYDAVTKGREGISRRFAELLCDWTASKTTDETIVPVEQLLERIVAPLATKKPLLVIVVDGMSVAVFRELMADILGSDWILLAEEGIGLRPALATVPSVTEVSRTSLLCGRLQQGNSAIERSGFAEHSSLRKACRSGFPPVLFHKAALQESDDGSLAADIRKEIGSTHRRIVGVVVNAVDDHLLKGEQIDTRWSRDEIKILPGLLHEAKAAGRTVIMLSDHGHILDCNTKGQTYEGGERWRFKGDAPTDGELRIKGPRVVMPDTGELIAPWTEKIRYGIKKNGYHGGVSPQEMIVPICVLNTTSDFPAGWMEAVVDLPVWWDVSAVSLSSDAKELQKAVKPKKQPAGLLFPLDEEPVPESIPVADAQSEQPEWVAALLSSPVFGGQKKLGGRAVPTDEVFSQLLSAIEVRGGKITSVALARAMRFPSLRLSGLLATVQRVLNVDGYKVLHRDEASDTIELNRDLLIKQFDLTG